MLEMPLRTQPTTTIRLPSPLKRERSSPHQPSLFQYQTRVQVYQNLNRANILEPFYTTKPKGTGLGLSMVRSVVERAHGNISIYSSSKGSTITMQFPLAESSQAVPSAITNRLYGTHIYAVDRRRRTVGPSNAVRVPVSSSLQHIHGGKCCQGKKRFYRVNRLI